ncbi:hypothetical protein A3860_26035 [Niastella vici]|uniref:Uncharacterized protein n=1 Tax=Niastella vici TaxID=1703345 RepID=A0A1V9FWR3_9BACT|nr:hypothetical protein A3860_26035 [Niastella vici]
MNPFYFTTCVNSLTQLVAYPANGIQVGYTILFSTFVSLISFWSGSVHFPNTSRTYSPNVIGNHNKQYS